METDTSGLAIFFGIMFGIPIICLIFFWILLWAYIFFEALFLLGGLK